MTASLRPFFSLFLLILGLAACTSAPQEPSIPPMGVLPPPANGLSAQQLLQQADASPTTEQALLLRLRAADQALQQKEVPLARQIIAQIPLAQLHPAARILAQTLLAELALASERPQQALNALKHASFERLGELEIKQQIRIRQARARTLEASQYPLEALEERLLLSHLVAGTTWNQNHEALWRLASGLPPSRLQVPTGKEDTDGWLSLALAMQQVGTIGQQQHALEQWQQQHPTHPAALRLPQALAQIQVLAAQPLSRVALLVPLSGQLSSAGQALRDGFLAAHLTASSQSPAIEHIEFYDSNRIDSLEQFLAQQQRKGTQLVIGPLLKSKVEQLGQQAQLPLPLLALNYIEGSTPPQLFQFGLGAEDEARQAAHQAWSEGHQRAIALAPNSEWGDRVLKAFTQAFQAKGGKVIAAEPLAEPVKLAGQIARLFKLRESETRAQELSSTLQQKVTTEPTRRQDVDCLFLAAPPQQAQQVRPTLVFQYAGDIPIYGTSQLNGVTGNTRQNQDMEGIQFTETPWILNPNLPLRQQVEQQWPQAGSALGRLYAMGADAYRIAPLLTQLAMLPAMQIEGLSGYLRLNAQRQIERTLLWAQFQKGQVVPVATTVRP